ncbi:hypothetical protein LUZ60_003358 [Juncus effusus]|nr:hypothetical protein LUZ60_003358 [Juncus effusus]
MGAKENGEEIDLDSEPVRDPLSSQPETHLNGAKRATRVPKKIIKKEIISPKPSRVSSNKLQYTNNKSSSNSNFNSPKKSPKTNNTVNNHNNYNNNIVIKSNLSRKKIENEIKEVLEETISTTSTEETKEIVDILDEAPNCDQSNSTDTDAQDIEEEQIIIQDQVHSKNNNEVLHQKTEELEMKLERMEMELCEAGVVEFAIYSVVSVHGGPDYKVHTPARRLCKVYVYACENWSKGKIGSLSRNVVSGLGLVAKSCGNDVSRLTFWLSNIIVLREKIKQTCQDRKTFNFYETSAFTSSLEKIESWIFSRIVESVWWQAITPPMQSQVQKQSNNSINLWINAFNNAINKLCPISSTTNKCGCLKQVSKMIMEQCIARLDVAMFNSILRESINELPTDPISDPISNPKVLPIRPGDFSFGSGAQLKNSIGNWSRYLNDKLGIDKNGLKYGDHDYRRGNEEMKYFNLLNELSELLMLPKDMILDPPIRQEVCPSFGVKLITRILCNFEPDEFCPESVPDFLIQELNSESIVEETLEKNLITSIPCTANLVAYHPPPSADVAQAVNKILELDKKGSFDDDELDGLDSTLSSVIAKDGMTNDFAQMNERYRLLKEIWS